MEDTNQSYQDSEQEETSEAQREKKSVKYWLKWISAAKESAKRHWDDSREAWEEYKHERDKAVDDDDKPKACYPIYYSSVKHLEAAYYSKTPKTRAKRRFDIDDAVANTAAFICHRLGEHLIDSVDFDEIMEDAVGDLIHADKACLQVMYEKAEKPFPVPLQVQQGEDGSLVFFDQDGEEFAGEVIQGPDGRFYYETDAVNGDIKLSPTPYCEVLHTPQARTESEVTEKAYKFWLSEEKAIERFAMSQDGSIDEELVRVLPWKEVKDRKESDDYDSNAYLKQEVPGRYLEGWEIYCKETKSRYWVAEGYHEFLDERDDELQLREFFPSTPFIIANKPNDSLYPVPTYQRLKSTVRQLHKLYARLFDLIDKARRRAIVDGSNPEVLQVFSEVDEGEFIIIQNLQKLIEGTGDLRSLVQYLPVQELVQCITELSQLTQVFKDNFNEWFGVPDIIRGVSDPIETATAGQIQAAAAHDRFKKSKKAVERMARDAIELMLDLALKVWTDDKIARVVGLQFAPEHQQYFAQGLQFLRDDQERFIRIDIETDSTTFMDEQRELARRQALSQLITQGLATLGSMENQEYAPLILEMLLANVSGMGGSEEYEEQIKQAVSQVLQKKQQEGQNPQQEPNADMMKQQIEQQKLQLQVQRDQVEAQIKMRELSQKEMKMQMDAQVQQSKSAIEQVKAQIEGAMAQFAMQIEERMTQLEELKTMLSAQEMVAEESRLAKQVEGEIASSLIEASKPTPQAPSVSVNIG